MNSKPYASHGDRMNGLKRILGTGKPTHREGDEVSLAFSALVHSNVEAEAYFTIMIQNGISEERANRLYNLILIACGRAILSSGKTAPQFPDHYVVAGDTKVSFGSCPMYTGIIQHMKTLNKDTITVLGVLSCEMVAFNACLNEMEKKLGHAPDAAHISNIALYPPELPC